jgi:RNA polymerase sigma factor (sigma-70 family)
MNRNEVSDKKLVSAYIKGNEEAFELLVERHKKQDFHNNQSIVRDTYLAEDLLQETFIKAIRTIKTGRYNEEGKFLPWILRIAHNLAIDHFRKDKRYPTMVLEDGSPVFNTLEFAEDSYESVQIRKDTDFRIKQFIDELPWFKERFSL